MSESPEKKPPQDLLDWLGYTNAPDWRVARPLGRIFGALVLVVFAVAIAAAVSVLYGTIRDVFFSETPQGPNLGAGALIAALLGAPFLIWGTVLKHQTVRWQKEGHMTDRISKAVEQLGAEKTVKKIVDGNTVETTEPNLEIRIGAILSLERIAQDSTTHDKGRDHVRVMEILCAYIRENAKAEDARSDNPRDLWNAALSEAMDELLPEQMSDRERAFQAAERAFQATGIDQTDAPLSERVAAWVKSLPKPRADIAKALQVLGRRTVGQRQVEAAWPDPADADSAALFESGAPRFTLASQGTNTPQSVLHQYHSKLMAWHQLTVSQIGYRLDLRHTNLQGADLIKGIFAYARFNGSRLEGANLHSAVLECADLSGTHLTAAKFNNATMTCADLTEAAMEGTELSHCVLHGAQMQDAVMDRAVCVNAEFICANMTGLHSSHSSFDSANVAGAVLNEVAFWRTDLAFAIELESEQLSAAFGDGGVTLPLGLDRPAHWPTGKLTWSRFQAELAQWRDNPATYTPPPPPVG